MQCTVPSNVQPRSPFPLTGPTLDEEMNLQVTYHSEQELLICRTRSLELKYRVFQIYGQKHVKVMDPDSGPEPTSEVYVSNVPRRIPVEKLFEFFAKCGKIYEMRLLMDFSGCNRGRCFVQFQTVRASREAICCLNGEKLEGNELVVRMSLNNNQLILKSIPVWMSEEFLTNVIRCYIGEGLKNVKMKRSRDTALNYCFCTYLDHQFAIMAHKKAWPFININGFMIDVHWANPELLRTRTFLYFSNFAPQLTKKEFFEALAKLVNLKTMVQFRIVGMHGSITFTNQTAMAAAYEAMKTLTIRGLTMKFSAVPFTANWLPYLDFNNNQSVNVVNRAIQVLPPPLPLLPNPLYCGGHPVPNQPAPGLHWNGRCFMPQMATVTHYAFYFNTGPY